MPVVLTVQVVMMPVKPNIPEQSGLAKAVEPLAARAMAESVVTSESFIFFPERTEMFVLIS